MKTIEIIERTNSMAATAASVPIIRPVFSNGCIKRLTCSYYGHETCKLCDL